MNKVTLLLALPLLAHAQNTVVLYDGDTNDYADFNPAFSGGSAFGVQTPAANYTGPAIYGGYELANSAPALTSWRVDSNIVSVNNADGLQWNTGGGSTGTVYGTFTFDSTADFTLDSNSFFRLNARRQGGKTWNPSAPGGNEAFVPTGLRWVLRDATSGQYYISVLNDSSAAQFGAAYLTNWGTATTENAPETLDWFEYDPTSGANSGITATAVADITALSFDQGGFYYSNSRNVSGSLNMDFAQFEMNAVPEPSAYALISGLMALGWLMVRRRK